MVVERRDSRLITAYKTRSLRRLISGEYTWTILKPGEVFYLSPVINTVAATGITKAITVDNEIDDKIHYSEIYPYTTENRIRQNRTVSGDEINNPLQPWFGKLRQRTLNP